MALSLRVICFCILFILSTTALSKRLECGINKVFICGHESLLSFPKCSSETKNLDSSSRISFDSSSLVLRETYVRNGEHTYFETKVNASESSDNIYFGPTLSFMLDTSGGLTLSKNSHFFVDEERVVINATVFAKCEQ